MILWLDFETRSRCDLTAKGSYNYAQDASTEVLCMSYAFDDEDVVTWRPGEPFPEAVRQHTGQIRAHNAAFERLIFWYVLQINFELEQFYCTAAQARANCAPGKLEDVGRFASADMKKDHRGAQLIRLLSIPQADGSFREDAALMQEMIQYCEQDVRAMRAVSKAMRDLSADELRDYHVNERINDRGVLVDLELCRAAMLYAQAELVEIEEIVAEVTDGEVTSVRSPRMREWVLARVGEQARKLMTVWKDGEQKFSIDKNARANLLALAEEEPDEVPPDVAEVIQCADDLWASSVAKFSRLEQLADEEDARVRGAFVFAGGAATGRASSYGAQVHNFTRKVAAAPADVRHAMVRGHSIVPRFGKRVTDVLKGMLRPALVPARGHALIVADWNAIEARMNPWLAAEPTSEAKLALFRNGEDVYKHNARATFHVPVEQVDDEQRQIGKVQELACGYGGGVGAFAAMGRVYGVRLPESDARRMVDAWRRANPWAVNYWQALESAYIRAMRHPGHEFSAGRVVYMFDGQHLWYALPSLRVLCYPYARLEDGEVSYAKAAWKPAADATEWPRARLWRGLACIAKGTPVLTERGWIAIECVRATDRVWDGIEWVRQEGVARQGLGRVSYTFGVAMTADHLVLTEAGWKRADETKGHRRATCRLPLRYRTDWLRRAALRVAHHLRLRANAGHEATELHEAGAGRPSSLVRVQEARTSVCRANSTWDEPTSRVRRLAVYAGSVSAAVASSVGELWRAGHHGVSSLARLIRGVLGRHGADLSAWAMPGPNRQRRAIFASELPMGDISSARSQSARGAYGGQPARPNADVRAGGENRHRRDDAGVPAQSGRDGRRLDLTAESCAEVFDLVNCGPRRRFVVQGIDGQPLIVHNCENICQAAANDVLRGALRRLDDVVLHVHDEIVLEVPEDKADEAAARLRDVMRTPPEWAVGLPLDAGVKIMQRYGK